MKYLQSPKKDGPIKKNPSKRQIKVEQTSIEKKNARKYLKNAKEDEP